MLFNMNGSKDIFADNFFTNQNSILIVVTFPRHKADQHIPAQRNLSVFCRRTIRNHISDINAVILVHNRHLIEAGTRVGTQELNNRIDINISIIGYHTDFICADALYHSGTFAQHTGTGINAGFIFHASTNNRRFCFNQRHCLPLHVGTHQSTVRIIIFQEWNHCRCN